jgi:general secretion pathway protein J
MKSKGFTLVEMLVAIGLMALMALLCWRGLVYVANQRETVTREAAELSQVVRTFAQIERDLAERLPNAALPTSGGPKELPLALGVYPVERDLVEFEVARFLPQPGGAPHAIRVLYKVGATGLSRSTRPLDAVPAEAKNDTVLLPGATKLQIRVHAGGFWTEPGRDGRVQPSAPATAIELAVEDGDGGRYVKVLPL